MLRKYYRVAIGMLLAVFMVFGGAISPLSGVNVYAAGVSVYIDGVNGNDSNDGSSAGKAVKSWDKARAVQISIAAADIAPFFFFFLTILISVMSAITSAKSIHITLSGISIKN